MRIDTSQELTIFPRPVGAKLIAISIMTMALGLVGIWMGVEDGMSFIAVLTFLLFPLGIWMLWVFVRRMQSGYTDPTMKLSPDGLHLVSGAVGVVPWSDLRSLGGFSVKGQQALVVNIDAAALARLEQSKLFKNSRKFDAMIGVHALAFFQQQLELPIADVADILHQYSIAHGGPVLKPDP